MNKAGKNAVKLLAGTAAVLGFAYFAVGEFVYERFLNRHFFMKNAEPPEFESDNTPESEEIMKSVEEFGKSSKEKIESLNPQKIKTFSCMGRNMYALLAQQEKETERWAIVCHGYCANPYVMGHYAEALFSRGFNVLLSSMVGHGDDESTYCSMGYYDRYLIKEWINYIVRRQAKAEIMLLGVSMGAASVMLATGEELPDNVKFAVADCGYTSLWDEYAHQMKQMFNLPQFPILGAVNTVSKLRGNVDFKRCSPKNAVARSKTPTLFIHGDKDTLVPYEMMDEIYNSCAAQKEKLTIENSPHALSVIVNPKAYWEKTDSFIEKYITAE